VFVSLKRIILRSLRDGPAALAAPPPDEAVTRAMAGRLAATGREKLGRSLALRHLDAGSCNGCELELHALGNIAYDLERFGLRFVASPRHADVLLVTGPLTRNLLPALEQTYAAMAEPRWVIAVGDCTIDGGVFKGSYACLGGVSAVPVDLYIRGCPPTPFQVLDALRSLLEANNQPVVRRT